jgi:hypothetical protein
MGKLLKTTGRILAENIHFSLSPFVISELQRLHKTSSRHKGRRGCAALRDFGPAYDTMTGKSAVFAPLRLRPA